MSKKKRSKEEERVPALPWPGFKKEKGGEKRGGRPNCSAVGS